MLLPAAVSVVPGSASFSVFSLRSYVCFCGNGIVVAEAARLISAVLQVPPRSVWLPTPHNYLLVMFGADDVAAVVAAVADGVAAVVVSGFLDHTVLVLRFVHMPSLQVSYSLLGKHWGHMAPRLVLGGLAVSKSEPLLVDVALLLCKHLCFFSSFHVSMSHLSHVAVVSSSCVCVCVSSMWFG